MADYKRMVSYMYQYDKGVKKKNIGYVRIEVKGNECKFTLSIQLPEIVDGIFPTYLIYRPENKMELIYLGDSILRNQVLEGRFLANEKNIGKYGCGIGDMGGMLLFLDDDIFYGTEWDDKPIVLSEVMEALRPKKKPSLISERAVVRENSKNLSQENTMPVNEKETLVRGTGMGNNKTKEIRLEAAGTQGACLNAGSYIPQNSNGEVNADTNKDVNHPANEKAAEQENPLAAQIFASHPRITPFEDREVVYCVKIEPKDIGYLPESAWILSNNSFLMHGYYCYNHLIFAKIRERNGYEYFLGVPGIYHSREEFMAKMFGFDKFKSIRRRNLRQGDFGYWYYPITL